MKRIVLSTLIALGAPAAAMAGGPATPTMEPPLAAPVQAAPYAQPVNWAGLYSGVSLGFGNSYTNTPGMGHSMGIAGVNLGYRYDMGPVVVGGELSYDEDNVGSSSNVNQIKNTAALKLIVGAPMGRTLVYGMAGVTRADATVAGVSGSDTGYTAGIGADYALNQQWTLGGELATDRYSNFNNSGADLKDTTVKLKIGYKF